MSGSKASWAALVYAVIATGTMVLNAAAPSAASQPPPPVIRHYLPHPAAFLLYFVRDTANLTEASKADLSRALRDQVGWDNACVEVNGFADPGKWSPEDVSKARADFLASELRRRGVSIPIQTKWRGGAFPNSKPGMTGYSPSLNMRTELIWDDARYAAFCSTHPAIE